MHEPVAPSAQDLKPLTSSIAREKRSLDLDARAPVRRSTGRVNIFQKKPTRWILLLLLAAAAYAGHRVYTGARPPELKYDTARVDRGNVIAKVTATGTLSALVTVQVGSQVSGRLKEILVDFNSLVTKGQVIARIDPQLFEAALEQAKANHLAAKANEARAKVQAEEAERQLERAANLADRNLVSEAERDTARANRDAARSQVDAASAAVAQTKAALHQAEINLAYTTITSPINGMVISRNVDVGQTVAASLQAPVLFVIAEDLRKMQVDTSVAEADIGKLRPGMEATFVVDAYPGKAFAGTVRQIRNAPQTVQNVVTYDAVIDVENSELELRPGMTANVTFVHARVEDVVRVPNAALRFRPSGEVMEQMTAHAAALRGAASPEERSGSKDALQNPGEKAVWVLDPDGAARRVAIRTGVSDGSMTELLSGSLEPGASLVVGVKGGGDAARSAGRPPRMF